MTDHHLEPLDEQEIFRALAPLRTDEESLLSKIEEKVFSHGVPSGVSESVVSQSEDESDEQPPEHGEWPTWLKRAASILPPGVTSTATLGKLPSGGAAGSAAGIVLAPFACLLLGTVGFIAALLATRNLDGGSRNLPNIRSRYIVYAAAIFLGGCGALFVGSKSSGAFGLILCGAVVAIAKVLSAAGIAHRSQVANVTVMLMFLALPPLLARSASDTSDTTLWSTCALLAGTALVTALVPLREAKRVWPSVLMGVAVVATVLFWNRSRNPVFGDQPASIVAWINNAELEAGDLSLWNEVGQAARCQSDEDRSEVDRDRLQKIIELGGTSRLHPVVAIAADRWKALPTAAMEAQARWLRGGEIRVRTRSSLDPFGSSRFDAQLLARLPNQKETLPPEIPAAIARSWPQPGDFDGVGHADLCIEAADAFGTIDLIARFQDEVQPIVASAWSGHKVTGDHPVGFHTNLTRNPSTSDVETTLVAVLLMRRFGVPPSVDLERLDRYLTKEMRTSDLQNPHPFRVSAALAQLVLRRDIGVPPLSTAKWISRHALLWFVIAAVALGVWITLRARPLPAVESGPLAAERTGPKKLQGASRS